MVFQNVLNMQKIELIPPERDKGDVSKSNIVRRSAMKYGTRNNITATVKAVKKGDIMSLVKYDITQPTEMASVLTTESAEDLELKPGDKVQLIIKAIHVLPAKEER